MHTEWRIFSFRLVTRDVKGRIFQVCAVNVFTSPEVNTAWLLEKRCTMETNIFTGERIFRADYIKKKRIRKVCFYSVVIMCLGIFLYVL